VLTNTTKNNIPNETFIAIACMNFMFIHNWKIEGKKKLSNY
jgi:hypothetical protein